MSGIQLDNTAGGSLIIRGPESGSATLQLPDMTGLVSQLLALDASGNFVFEAKPTAYSLPVATGSVLGGVKQGSGITIAGDGTISAAAGGVTSVAGRSGAVTLTAGDVSGLSTVATSGAYADLTGKPTIPSAVSQLTNDSGFQTSSQVTSAIQAVVGSAPAALDTLNELASALGNDANFAATMTTALAAKANTSSLATVATSGLYSDLTGKPSLATVATSGAYADLTGKPTIPTAVSALTNDSGYISVVPTATASVKGGVKVGSGIAVAGDGTISATGELVSGSNGSLSVLATVNTTDATVTTAASFALADNSSVLFTADVVCKNGTGSAGAGFTLEGLVHRASGAASVAFTGSALKSIVARDVAAWDANVVANTSTGSFDIQVTGAAATNLSWFANVKVTHIN